MTFFRFCLGNLTLLQVFPICYLFYLYFVTHHCNTYSFLWRITPKTVDIAQIYVTIKVLCIDVATALLMQIYLAGRESRLKLIGQGWPLPRAV